MAKSLDSILQGPNAFSNDSKGLEQKAERVKSYIKNRLGHEASIRVHRMTDSRGVIRPTIVASFGKSSRNSQNARPVLLIAHLDTIDGDATKVPKGRSGNFYQGRGALDDGGGIVVAVESLAALQKWSSIGDVVLVISGEEEIGSPRAREILARYGRNASIILGLEPTRANGDVVYARMGTAGGRVSFIGKAGHVNDPSANAMHAAVRFSALLQDFLLSEGAKPDSSSIRYNFGGFKADSSEANVRTKMVVVPFTVRVSDPIQLTRVREKIKEFAHVSANEFGYGNVRVGVELNVDRNCDAWFGSSNNPGFKLVEDTHTALGFGPLGGVGPTPGVSDVNFAVSGIADPKRIVAVDGLAPKGRGFHGPDEAIDLTDFARAGSVLASTIASAQGKELVTDVQLPTLSSNSLSALNGEGMSIGVAS